MSCHDNAKVSDSGYTNTCGNSQSQRSSESSLCKNRNRSQSSGHCGGNPSIFGASNEALPKPISKKKEKEDNKKSKSLTHCNVTKSAAQAESQQMETRSYTAATIGALDSALKQSELGTVELMDATDPREHNGNPHFNTPKEGLGCQTNSLDNTSPNSNGKVLVAIVSLNDGLVVHLTASMETALGYSKDAWVGQSFIDYVHPKDKATFADKLAKSVIPPFGEGEKDFGRRPTSLFCNLRRYSDVGINKNVDMDTSNDANERYRENLIDHEDKCCATAIYIAFHLHLSFKHYRNKNNGNKTDIMFLVITAQPIFSAYKVPKETILSSKFSTRHTATGHLSHVDDDVVQYFGYLPQDMLGSSQFSYYHPADYPHIKDIYETVVRLGGSSFKSKPYRFAVQNGGYVVLETEWSSFINPWEKKLEFVTGHHRVLQGPENPDVFQPQDMQQREFSANMGEAMMKESEIIQNEICTLLAKEISKTRSVNAYKVSERSNDLVTFMESLIQEARGITTPITASTKTTKTPMVVADDRSFSKHDSVMLDEISPHHENCDSKSSSETPPSYNQLNYNEKIKRFFNSKPVLTTVYGNGEENVNLTALNSDENVKTSSNHTPSSLNIQNHDSGGCDSNENLSSGSNNQTSTTSRENSVNGNSNPIVRDNFKSVTLTEKLLNQHNQEMEKLMMKKHKERRTDMKNSKLNKKATITSIEPDENDNRQPAIQSQLRGCKRRNSPDQENEVFKIAKYDETTKIGNRGENSTAAGNNPVKENTKTNNSRPSMDVWSQMTVTQSLPSVNPLTHDLTQSSTCSHVLPIYHIPVPQLSERLINRISHQASDRFSAIRSVQSTPHPPCATASLTGAIYPSIIHASALSSMIYAPSMLLKVSTIHDQSTQKLEVAHPPETIVDGQRPSSQATSIKAEPGSIRAMSESSRKLLSPGGHFSSCLSVENACSSQTSLPAPIHNTTQIRHTDSSLEDSSDSSFYGGFLNTSSGSSCNSDQIRAPRMPEKYMARNHEAMGPGNGRFSMINGLKANFELPTPRQTATIHQKMIPKRDRGEMQQQSIKMTPEIIYRYQMNPKTLAEVLKADRDHLKTLHQPMLVNDQLDQLYLDLQLDGFGTKLILDDANQLCDNDCVSAECGSSNISPQHQRVRREMTYSEMAMVYEEDAPLPSSV